MSDIKTKFTPNEMKSGARALFSLVMKYGYTVLIPFGEGRRYDMVIEKDAQFSRASMQSWKI